MISGLLYFDGKVINFYTRQWHLGTMKSKAKPYVSFLDQKRPFPYLDLFFFERPYLDYYAFFHRVFFFFLRKFHGVVISSNFAVQIPKGNKTQKTQE